MISTTHNFIFIHIPRTAGKAICYALGNRDKIPGRHFFARRIKQELGKADWDSYFKFAFVRNPWDRTVSLYFHQTKTHPDDRAKFRTWLMDQVKKNGYPNNNGLQWKSSFGNESSTGGISVPWKCYSDWILDEEGEVCLDFIGRYESLIEDWKHICAKLKINAPLKVENATNHHHYTYYFNGDRELIKLVEDWYARDLERFDYKYQTLLL